MKSVSVNKILVLPFLVLLSACQYQPLDASYMQPRERVYSETEDGIFLKEKIKLGTVLTVLPEQQKEQFSNFPVVLKSSLEKAGFLADNEAKASYELNAEIKEVKGSCHFTVCEAGSAIHYSLTDVKSNLTKYDELIVVPFSHEYPGLMCALVGCNQVEYLFKTWGGAVGENVSHLIRVLSMKTKQDLK